MSATPLSLFDPPAAPAERAAAAFSAPVQRTLEGMGVPLAEATFVVLDLETTGGNVHTDGITEVGAVKVRGGEVLGTLQTMVNPGIGIPANITVLTGITDAMVMRAPTVESVLPTLLDFIGGAVIVGHNVRFDMSFINSAVRNFGGPMLGNQRIDTLALARRLLVDEVRSFRLGELARCLRLPHQPCHRALDDAWATVDLLHLLIERASAWGVTGLDDLIALPTVAGHPQWRKLSLTTALPRKPGVYFFCDGADRVLYVGKATDLRSRVRSYFSSDRRRKVAQLLRETTSVRHRVCRNTLEAELLELRLIREHKPRFNARHTRPPSSVWIKLTTAERFPRLSVVRAPKGDGVHLGPVGGRRTAELVIEAIQTIVPLRRCTGRIPKGGGAVRSGQCMAAQIGVAACPCTGELSETSYAPVVARARAFMTSEPHVALELLSERMQALAATERFEEAAAVRNRAGAFAAAVDRQRRLDFVAGLGTVEVESDGRSFHIATADLDADERLLVAGWLERYGHRGRVCADAQPLGALPRRMPSFAPIKR